MKTKILIATRQEFYLYIIEDVSFEVFNTVP